MSRWHKHRCDYNLEQESALLWWIDAEHGVLALPPTVEAEYVIVQLVRRSSSALQKYEYIKLQQI